MAGGDGKILPRVSLWLACVPQGGAIKLTSLSRDFTAPGDARPCLPQWALDYAEDSARCAHSSAHWAEGKELRFRIRQQPETPWGLKRPQSSLNSLKEQLERKAWGRG